MSIDWKRKLSSRKFWLALVGFITPVLYLFNVAETDVESIVSIIMSGAALIAYILAEGFVDAHRDSGPDGDFETLSAQTCNFSYPLGSEPDGDFKIGGTE